MLFSASFALLVLMNTLQAAAAATKQEITIVGPTEESAAFIAVRPITTPMQPQVATTPMQPEVATTPMQPEVSPHPMTTGMAPQPAAEERETEPEPMTMEIPMQTGGGTMEMPMQTGAATMGVTGKKAGRQMPAVNPMQLRMMIRLQNMLERPGLTATDREMIRGILRRMRGTRRVQRRTATQEQMIGRMEPGTRMMEPRPMERPMMGGATMQRTTMERPATAHMMERPTTEAPMMERRTMGRPTMERPTMVRPTIERPMTELPMMDPMPAPETEQATPAASEMSVRGARFNTAVGTIDIGRETMGREGPRMVPGIAVRDVEFNTFVGRLRAQRAELAELAEEPRWERGWMPRRRFVGFE